MNYVYRRQAYSISCRWFAVELAGPTETSTCRWEFFFAFWPKLNMSGWTMYALNLKIPLSRTRRR